MNRFVTAIGLCIALTGASLTTAQPSSAALATRVVPAPSSEGRPSAPTPSEPVAAGGLVAYGSDDGIWVANVDGTGAHQLVANVAGGGPLAWSADGSRLLYRTGLGFGLTDPTGSRPVEVDLQCPPATGADADLAACEADNQGVSLSPDGSRLAYPIWEGSFVQGSPVTSSLVVLDLETGRVGKVGSTETPVVRGCGENRSPRWSPDGKRLAFVRTIERRPNDPCVDTLLTIDLDGSDEPQVVAPSQVQGDINATWSPDGSRFLLDGFVAAFIDTERTFAGDIYSVRADGTEFHALTIDGRSGSASWTRDGRIAFTRWTGTASGDPGDVWVMDADGGNATKVDSTLPALTAAGCLACPYPYNAEIDRVTAPETPQLKRFETMPLLWQP